MSYTDLLRLAGKYVLFSQSVSSSILAAICAVMIVNIMINYSVYLLSGYWYTGVQHHTIQALHHVLAVAVDEAHPEPSQTKVFAKTPHTMSSLGVRQLWERVNLKFKLNL